LGGFFKRPTDQPLRAASASNIPSKPERPHSLSDEQSNTASGLFNEKFANVCRDCLARANLRIPHLKAAALGLAHAFSASVITEATPILPIFLFLFTDDQGFDTSSLSGLEIFRKQVNDIKAG